MRRDFENMPRNLPKSLTSVGILALILASNVLVATSASAEFFGCNDRHAARSWSTSRSPSYARSSSFTHEFAAQSRPRVTIHPEHRYLSPNAKRQCRAWLEKEYRVSGTVIVPKERCWWE
jgi:hypothetical protein